MIEITPNFTAMVCAKYTEEIWQVASQNNVFFFTRTASLILIQQIYKLRCLERDKEFTLVYILKLYFLVL